MSTTSKREVQISKALSWLLRHGAIKEKLSIDTEGYVPLAEILNHNRLKTHKTSFEEIQSIVENNDKKRFTLKQYNDRWFICANQGHSIAAVSDEHLTALTKIEQFPEIVVHGTYGKSLDAILSSGGLSRMNRVHIHFAPGLPHSDEVISGMRTSCNLFIYLDVGKCLENEIKFFESSNKVILSPGNQKGFIPKEFFSKITKRDGTLVEY